MPTDLDQIVESRREDMVGLLTDLIAAKTENPPDTEAPAAEVVMRCFDSSGIPYETYEKEPGRTNVIGAVGQGAPSLLVACHLDTVPAGDGWDRFWGRAALPAGMSATGNAGRPRFPSCCAFSRCPCCVRKTANRER